MSLGRSASGGVAGHGGGAVGRALKKVEKPRPLKLGSSSNRLSLVELSSVEDIVVLMENVQRQLVTRNYDRAAVSGLRSLCLGLKQSGPQLEAIYKDQLDKLQVVLRNACRDESLDLVSRIHLLEIIELRAMQWMTNENVTNYYKQKLAQVEYEMQMTPSIKTPDTEPTTPIFPSSSALPDINQPPTIIQNLLQPGEVVTTSGRFSQPTKIPGKNYYKDEIVIRNADSGKVMGLKGRRVHMIEEMSETIISFQRVVPGARERLVQITGPGHDNIVEARGLIEETIRRNQSPVRSENSGEDGSVGETEEDSRRNTLVNDRNSCVAIGEYKYTVNVGEESIKITGSCLNLVRTAKLVLDEYFLLEAQAGTDSITERMEMGSPPPPTPAAPAPVVKPEAPKETIVPTISSSQGSLRQTSIQEEAKLVSVTRQPLFPSAPKTAFTEAESSKEPAAAGSAARRANFARTAKEGSEKEAVEKERRGDMKRSVGSSKPELMYGRDELLLMSEKAVWEPPEGWEKVAGGVARKGGVAFKGKEHLDKGMAVFSVDYVKSYVDSED